jgi:TonB family protein
MIRWIQIAAPVWYSYVPWIIGQNSIFLLLTFGILFLLRKHSANLKYWIGLLALVKCLIPPFLPAPFLNGHIAPEASIQITSLQTLTPVAARASEFPFSLIETLFLVWLLSAMILFIAPWFNTMKLSRKLRFAEKISFEKKPGHILVFRSETIQVPMTLGLIHPRIYIPKQWDDWSESCREMIIKHEMTHILRKDSWFRIIQILVQALYAFHPLIWLLNRRLDEYREMACDDASAGRHRNQSIEYARALVQIAEDLKRSEISYSSASALIKQRNELLNRVQYQLEERMKRFSKWKTGFILIGIILLMLPLSWIRARTDQQEKTNPDWVGKIYGVVTSTETGEALAGANIVIMGTQKGAAADGNGRYFIPQVPPGKYDLQAVMIGYGNVLIKDVIVKLNESTELNFQLGPQVIPFSRIAEQVKKTEKLKTSQSNTPNPPPPPPDDTGYVFVPYDTPPEPVGGFKAIQENLVYPELAVKAGIEGRVTVNTQIDKNGRVTQTKVIQSLGPNGCDEAAVAAIRAVKWQPAMNRDQPVKVWISVPIDFKLNKKPKTQESE